MSLPKRLASALLVLTLLIPLEGAALQETRREERVEYETSEGAAGYRRLVTREESGDRRVETWVVEAAAPNGAYEALLEVEEETVRVDAETTRVIQREFVTDPDGRRVLRQTIEEERVEQPNGSSSVQRDVSEVDLDGRPRLTRRETETTTADPDGTFRTETVVARPGINRSGFVPTERTLEDGRRDEDGRPLESDLTVYSDATGAGRWEALERRITSWEYREGETATTENVYRRDASGNLELNEQIVSREWTAPGGVERTSRDVYSTDIPGERSLTRPELLRQVEVSRRESPDGGWEVTREVREDRQGRFRLVEREVETASPNAAGGVDVQRTLEQLDANGRMSRVASTTASTR